jgi:ATP-dependent helicase/nuclease subunit A
MAGMKWTEEQKKVIDLRNRNILVSAAAGSGKTAVLVERIISMISEGEHPVDIDRLLIVTFTNKAAAEMRERIGKAIDKKIQEMPESAHLQKQMTLIHSAQITTIHSFCLNVIRNHFNTIDLDPSFRIADEAELTLLKSDVLEELLEDYYEEGGEDFLDFIESFSTGKSDDEIEDLVLKLYHFSMSYPWPDEWLEEKKSTFNLSSVEDMKKTDWMIALLDNIHSMIRDMMDRCREALSICNEADGPAAYIPALQCDMGLLEELIKLQDYEDYGTALSNFKFVRLSGKKEEGVSEDKKSQVKAIRDDIKKVITDLKKNYFFQSPEDMLADLQAMSRQVEVLINLTKDFAAAFADKKADKNLVDFNDLEHFALNILVQRENGVEKPSHAADELSEYYEEILIDEYQDSNFVQEKILNSISKERIGKPNLFMVGDVKQSIYKFRLARPELFMEKYMEYSTEDNLYQRIDLHKNFRSRAVVLNSINFLFEQIMTRKLGNIEYDHKVALYPGADFGTEEMGISKDTELMLIDIEPKEERENEEEFVVDFKEEEVSQEEEEYTAKEIEAKAIARRIKELTNPETGLVIKDGNTFRTARYRDIVVLLRTMSNWSEVFADTLGAEDIPAHTDTGSGYFSTTEIRTILNLLKVIDNPRQDIPFTSVLRSPVVGLTSNELAKLRIPHKGKTMYEAAVDYVNDHTRIEDENKDKPSNAVEADNVKNTAEESGIIYKNEIKESKIEHIGSSQCIEESNLRENQLIDDKSRDNNLSSEEKNEEYPEKSNSLDEKNIDNNQMELNLTDSLADEQESSKQYQTDDLSSKERIDDNCHKERVLADKLRNFLHQLERYRNMVCFLSIHQLILKVLEDTGYYHFAAAMPGGEKRKANIDMLVQKAVQFENTSYSGLFHFVRYIEKLHKYDIDFGEATVAGENDNTVKIMSIHKSKGLEFPIVFVAGTGKVFNNQDSRGKLLIHPDLGLGPDYIDHKLRIKAPTLVKKVIQKELVLENLGEELRVLYVALTRAKEKLIITGGVKKLEDKLKKWSSICKQKEKQLLFYQLSTAGNYLDWIVPAAMRYKGFEEILKDYGAFPDKSNPLYNADIEIVVKKVSYEELAREELGDQVFKKVNKDQLLHWNNHIVYNESIRNDIQSLMEYQYPYEAETNIHTKLTVSELKRLGQMEAEELGMPLKGTEGSMDEIPVPSFIKLSEKPTKAGIGTLYHSVLESMNLLEIYTLEDVERFLTKLVLTGKISEKELELLDKDKLCAFVQSEMADRMRNAIKNGSLYKERQFVMGIKANEINKSFHSEELVLVQGIIDVYFKEGDRWILLDYKTDNVDKKHGEEILRKRYKVQMDYYQKALEQLTGICVSERIIYSFALGKEIKTT